jgi:hypothetical protein
MRCADDSSADTAPQYDVSNHLSAIIGGSCSCFRPLFWTDVLYCVAVLQLWFAS